jgi:hypothetical protein
MHSITKSLLVVSLAFGAAALTVAPVSAAQLGVGANSNSNVGVTAPGVGVGVGAGADAGAGGSGSGSASGGASMNSGARTQGSVATAPDNDASVKTRSSGSVNGKTNTGKSGVRLQDKTNLNGSVGVH